MAFLLPAKWQALHSSVCTVNYGKTDSWELSMVKPNGGLFLKQLYNLEKINPSPELMGPCDTAGPPSSSGICLLFSLPWALWNMKCWFGALMFKIIMADSVSWLSKPPFPSPFSPLFFLWLRKLNTQFPRSFWSLHGLVTCFGPIGHRRILQGILGKGLLSWHKRQVFLVLFALPSFHRASPSICSSTIPLGEKNKPVSLKLVDNCSGVCCQKHL